jgi:hypothetical protein
MGPGLGLGTTDHVKVDALAGDGAASNAAASTALAVCRRIEGWTLRARHPDPPMALAEIPMTSPASDGAGTNAGPLVNHPIVGHS